MSLVTVKALTKQFESDGKIVTAVKDLDLTLQAGEFVCLLGPSGCGKTTTLRSVAGLEQPTAGEITIGGQVVYSSSPRVYVPTERRGLGMVFQSYAVWPHMTVAENVGFPLKHGARGQRGSSKQASRERVMDMLDVMDCAHLADRYPSELSGGQQQRVALARTLVYEPDLLLFDEPLSNLDAKLRERMRHELRALQQRLGFAAIYVTHDREEGLALSDRMLVMKDGEIVQQGSPEEVYERPVDAFVADFVGPVNLLSVSSAAVDGDHWVATTDIGPVHCGHTAITDTAGIGSTVPASVLARPTAVVVGTNDHDDGQPSAVNSWRARVLSTTYLGENVIYTLGINETVLRASAPAHTRIGGESVTVTLLADSCRLVAGRLDERGSADGRRHAAAAAAGSDTRTDSADRATGVTAGTAR